MFGSVTGPLIMPTRSAAAMSDYNSHVFTLMYHRLVLILANDTE